MQQWFARQKDAKSDRQSVAAKEQVPARNPAISAPF
jgi:hypothetical protein